MPSKKLNTQEAAAYLGVKPCTLELWRCRKKGPRYFKLGSRVMYDLADLDVWFFSRGVHHRHRPSTAGWQMTSIFDQVKAALAPRLPEVLAELLPGGRVTGREYVCASLRGGVGTSCSTSIDTGKGSDFATGESWGDVIALAAKVWSMRQGEAAQELARLCHIDTGQNTQQPLRQPVAFSVILPVPGSAPQPPRCHAQHGQASALWRYADGQDRTLGYVARFETPEGKVILPLCFGQYGIGRVQWVWKALPEPRPLYGLPSLAAVPDDAPVLLVEGEKTATPLARYSSSLRRPHLERRRQCRRQGGLVAAGGSCRHHLAG